jgi:hypothetical protein
MPTNPIRVKEFFDAFRRSDYPDATTDEIVKHLARRLRGFFRLRLPHHNDADLHDDVQNTTHQVLRAVERYDPARSPWKWILGIAAKIACEAERKEARERRHRGALADIEVARRREVDRVGRHCIADERLALLDCAIEAIRNQSRFKPETIEAGWELLRGVPREEVERKYGMGRDEAYRAKNLIRAALRRFVRERGGGPGGGEFPECRW